MSYHIGLADERVVGLAKIDAWAYRTKSWYVRHYGPKVLSIKAVDPLHQGAGGGEGGGGGRGRKTGRSMNLPNTVGSFPPPGGGGRRVEDPDGPGGAPLTTTSPETSPSTSTRGTSTPESFPEVDFGRRLTVELRSLFQPHGDGAEAPDGGDRGHPPMGDRGLAQGRPRRPVRRWTERWRAADPAAEGPGGPSGSPGRGRKHLLREGVLPQA